MISEHPTRILNGILIIFNYFSYVSFLLCRVIRAMIIQVALIRS